MSSLTEKELRVSKIIEKALSKEITAKPEIQNMCTNIKLSMYSFEETIPKTLLVNVEENLLRFLRVNYKKFMASMKNEFQNVMILVVRNNAVTKKKDALTVNRKREDIISDICFPATIKGRSQEVESINDVLQHIYLDNKQQYWSDAEMKAIECIAGKILNERFVVEMFSG
ncbi:hypothetical protein NUSPORA_01854 [Nucleospora cyclopteri]